MVFNGTMVLDGICKDFLGFGRICLDLYLMVFHGIYWYSMAIDGIPRCSMVFHGIHRDSYGFLRMRWYSMVFNGI